MAGESRESGKCAGPTDPSRVRGGGDDVRTLASPSSPNLLDRGCRGGAYVGGRVLQALLQRVKGDARFGGFDVRNCICRVPAEMGIRVFESESEARDMRLAGIQKRLCGVVSGPFTGRVERGDEGRTHFANTISRLGHSLARHRLLMSGEMRENQLGAFADCGLRVSKQRQHDGHRPQAQFDQGDLGRARIFRVGERGGDCRDDLFGSRTNSQQCVNGVLANVMARIFERDDQLGDDFDAAQTAPDRAKRLRGFCTDLCFGIGQARSSSGNAAEAAGPASPRPVRNRTRDSTVPSRTCCFITGSAT